MAAHQVQLNQSFDNQSFDNQSFDTPITHSLPSSSSSSSSLGSRKRPLPGAPQDDLFAKAHKACFEAGLVPLEIVAGCKIISHDFEKTVKTAPNMGHSKKVCRNPGHRSTQGFHKKLFYLIDAHERVAVRKLLTSRINVTNFENSLRSQFFDLRCYNYAEIILACFPIEDYRKRWIVLEEEGVGRKFIHFRQLTEDTKSKVKMIFSRSDTSNSLKNKLMKQIPCLRFLTVYDILMSVYGEEFYSKNRILQQCGPIADLADRLIDRYRCRERALISPITCMIAQTDGKLTMEQKHVVIGLLHQKTNLGKVKEDLARIFPESFSSRSYIDVLDETFGNYRDVCILTEPDQADSTVQTFILDDKFSSKSVLEGLKKEKQSKNGKKKKKNWNQGTKQWWKKGQVVGKSVKKAKGGVI